MVSIVTNVIQNSKDMLIWKHILRASISWKSCPVTCAERNIAIYRIWEGIVCWSTRVDFSWYDVLYNKCNNFLFLKFLMFSNFRALLNLFFCRNFFLIHFGAKKVFFLSICGCWSNWWKKFRVHCGTSCKIGTPTDNNCGNESKIRLTHKIRHFMPTFLPPGFWPKNTESTVIVQTFSTIIFRIWNISSCHFLARSFWCVDFTLWLVMFGHGAEVFKLADWQVWSEQI